MDSDSNANANGTVHNTNSDLKVQPTLLGERNDPGKTGSVFNIHPHNLSLSALFRSICRGIIQNIQELMSEEILLAHGIQTIYGTGSALLRNPILQEELQRIFHKLDIIICHDVSDSAAGAAFVGKMFEPIQ
jgi:sedoheptulokinase